MGGFYPISPLVVITNTSYAAQAGVMDEKWAARVVRGKKIIVEKTMTELGLDNFVGVIYGFIRVEGLSRHSVAMCAGRLMQFARRYEQSGICPDYEEKDLVREGEEPATKSHSSDISQYSETSIEQAGMAEAGHGFSLPRLEQMPNFKPPSPADSWRSEIEAHSTLMTETAAYCSRLGLDHLKAIFGRTADLLVRSWGSSGKAADLVTNFASFIHACSPESQLPRTGSDRITIETGTCEMLRIANELSRNGVALPAGYPCAFHEILASKVAYATGTEISVNTSSSGCSVTISMKQSA
jgi:hypothetical protein